MKAPIKWNHLLLMLLGCLMLSLAGCSSGDDDDDNDAADDDTGDDDDDDNDDDDNNDDDTTDDDDDNDTTDDDDDDNDDNDDNDDASPPTEPISIRLKDFVTDAAIVGATCELVHNGSGTSFDPPISTTSDSNGFCEFNTAEKEELFSVKFTKAGYVESYFFNYSTRADWYFYTVSTATRALIFLSLGLSYDDTKGAVVGGVKWWPEVGNSQDVGCAEVTSSGGDTIYYMNDSGLPSTERDSTNPNDGYFLSLLMDPGEYTFTADVDGDVEEEPVPQVFADCLTYININYFAPEYATNPTPGGCTK